MKKIIILLTCAILLCGCGNGNMVKSQKTSQNNEQKYTSELFAMDTYMEITAYGDNAKEAVAKASARINELDGMLSTGNSDSEVSKLNSEKKLKLSEDVGNIMERSLEIQAVSLILQYIQLCSYGVLIQRITKFLIKKNWKVH